MLSPRFQGQKKESTTCSNYSIYWCLNNSTETSYSLISPLSSHAFQLSLPCNWNEMPETIKNSAKHPDYGAESSSCENEAHLSSCNESHTNSRPQAWSRVARVPNCTKNVCISQARLRKEPREGRVWDHCPKGWRVGEGKAQFSAQLKILKLWNQQAGTGKDLTRRKEWEFELLLMGTWGLNLRKVKLVAESIISATQH